MTWTIRHEGSPRSIEGLTLPQVVEGLQDGLWEPTDEIMGLDDVQWVHLEDHPQFAELTADLEPPRLRHYDDETRLDMNPLIDVCLVLLIFFILTTSYAVLEKVLDMPTLSPDKPEGPAVMTPQQVKEFTIKVEARMEQGRTVLRVEDAVVARESLVAAIRRWVKETRKTELLLDAGPDVDWGTVVSIQDAAKGAGVQRVHYLERQGTKGTTTK